MALLAIELSSGVKTYDTASWAGIVESGALILDQCVAPPPPPDGEGGLRIPTGGGVLTGQLSVNIYKDLTTIICRSDSC